LSAVCPYCAFRSEKRFQFLTQAQQRYVAEYCATLHRALESGEPGEYIIDMDAVADATAKDSSKPDFYYAEEQQQNLFTCRACDGVTDVLGTYAYCSVCGTRNDLQELETRIQTIRDRANSGGPYEACARDAVAAFDSFASQYAKQLLSRVPLTRSRSAKLEQSFYHNLDAAAEIFQSIFGIDILDGVSTDDRAFGAKMFHRRHVYEHKEERPTRNTSPIAATVFVPNRRSRDAGVSAPDGHLRAEAGRQSSPWIPRDVSATRRTHQAP